MIFVTSLIPTFTIHMHGNVFLKFLNVCFPSIENMHHIVKTLKFDIGLFFRNSGHQIWFVGMDDWNLHKVCVCMYVVKHVDGCVCWVGSLYKDIVS